MAELCATIFGSLGNIESATGGSIDQFFDAADSNKSGKVCTVSCGINSVRNPLHSGRQQIEISLALQVSFAELVTVFVLEELRSSCCARVQHSGG